MSFFFGKGGFILRLFLFVLNILHEYFSLQDYLEVRCAKQRLLSDGEDPISFIFPDISCCIVLGFDCQSGNIQAWDILFGIANYGSLDYRHKGKKNMNTEDGLRLNLSENFIDVALDC
jgi:hypothetical protein